MSKQIKTQAEVFQKGLILRNNDTPDEDLLAPGETHLYWDDTNGASTIKYRGKSADGSVVNGSVDGSNAPTPDGPVGAIQSYNGVDALVGSADFTRDAGTGEVSNVGDLTITGNIAASGDISADNADVATDLTVGGKAVVTGAIFTAANAAPADGALAAGQVAIWFDDTNGAAKLMIKGKSANGTVVTGEVALA